MKHYFRKCTAALITLAMICGSVCLPATSEAAKKASIQHASVHDPSIVYCQEDGKYYAFGSHQAVSRSKDLMNWENTGKSIYKKPVEKELAESFAWSGYKDGSTNAKNGIALWAPCVIYNPYYQKNNGRMGSYMIYYPASSNYKRGCIGFAVSDQIATGYEYADTVLYSGFTKKGGKDETDCADTVDTNYEKTNLKELIENKTLLFNDEWLTEDGSYNIGNYPQAIDPTVFFDADENMWMVYGSHGGGIWLLPMDRATGKPKFLSSAEVQAAKDAGQNADAYFGYQITSEGEGPYILYDKENSCYVLTVTYGQITDGYNQRLFKSDKVTGIYTDCAGNSAVYQGEIRNQDSLGVKLMGNYTFQDTSSYQFGGHNSLINIQGQLYNIYHQRFSGSTSFSDRVHPVFRNEKGWYCMSVYEYAGDTFQNKGYDLSEITGSYQFVNHGTSTSSAQLTTYDIELREDGTITGALSGTWTYQKDKSYMSLTINGITYDGVFFKQQDESGKNHTVMTFTAVGSNNESVWGSRYDKKPKAGKLKTSTKKPAYAFDFGTTDNYMVQNSGTGTTAAILTGNASVAEDDEMGTSLLCKDGDSALTLGSDAFTGLGDGLSVAFWTKADKDAILFSSQSDNSQIELKADGTATIRTGCTDPTTPLLKGDIDLSEWSYVGLSISQKEAFLYVNGNIAAKANMTEDGSHLFDVMANTASGLLQNYFGKGSVAMDNIEIYASALSEEDFDHKYDTSYSWEDEWKIDFGPKDSPQWEAYTMMYNTTVYKAGGVAQSYGFTEEIDAYETAAGGNKIRDFVYKAGGGTYTFQIDLPKGTYSVFVYSGNKEADNTLNFYFNDESEEVHTQTTPEGVGSDNYGGENTYETYVNTGTLSITFWGDESLGKDAVTGALNSLEIQKISDDYPEPKATAATQTAVESTDTGSAPADSGGFPWIPVGIGIVVLCVAAAIITINLSRKKR